MARNMPGRSVSRPAQGNNSQMREDPKWAPKQLPAPTVVSTGTVTNPKSAGAQARFKPDPVRVTTVISTVAPAS